MPSKQYRDLAILSDKKDSVFIIGSGNSEFEEDLKSVVPVATTHRAVAYIFMLSL